jgi:hypothetical protein
VNDSVHVHMLACYMFDMFVYLKLAQIRSAVFIATRVAPGEREEYLGIASAFMFIYLGINWSYSGRFIRKGPPVILWYVSAGSYFGKTCWSYLGN